MPYIENDVYLYFKKEIEESANKRINELKSEIESTKENGLKRIKEDINETVEKVLETELNEINVDFSASMNRIKTNAHQKIIKKKQELLDSIIVEVTKKCMEFVNTDEYKTSMRKTIKKINDTFCGDNFLFKIKKGDTKIKEIIKTEFSKKYKIEEVDTIKIGGFIGICNTKGILTDQTIDYQLEDARQRFYERSTLAINQ